MVGAVLTECQTSDCDVNGCNTFPLQLKFHVYGPHLESKTVRWFRWSNIMQDSTACFHLFMFYIHFIRYGRFTLIFACHYGRFTPIYALLLELAALAILVVCHEDMWDVWYYDVQQRYLFKIFKMKTCLYLFVNQDCSDMIIFNQICHATPHRCANCLYRSVVRSLITKGCPLYFDHFARKLPNLGTVDAPRE